MMSDYASEFRYRGSGILMKRYALEIVVIHTAKPPDITGAGCGAKVQHGCKRPPFPGCSGFDDSPRRHDSTHADWKSALARLPRWIALSFALAFGITSAKTDEPGGVTSAQVPVNCQLKIEHLLNDADWLLFYYAIFPPAGFYLGRASIFRRAVAPNQ